MLQPGLRAFIGIRRRQRRCTGEVRRAAAVQEVVVVQALAEQEVIASAAIAVGGDFRRTFLRDIRRRNPGFDRVFTTLRNHIVEFAAVIHRSAGDTFTAVKLHTPAAHPLVILTFTFGAIHGQVERGRGATGIRHDIAAAFLELPQADLVLLEAAAAGTDDAVIQYLGGAAVSRDIQY